MEGQVSVDDFEEEEDDKDGVEEDTKPYGPSIRQEKHRHKKGCRQEDIDEDALEVVLNRIEPLTHEIAERHRRRIPSKTSPGTSHIAILGNEEDVDSDKHSTAR